MKFRNPNTYSSRSGIASAVAIGTLAALAACNGSSSETPTVTDATVFADRSPVTLSWPDRRLLSPGCPNWSQTNLGPVTEAEKDGTTSLLVMVDARLGSPKDCNPVTDSGAGAQRGASAKSGAINLPDGEYYRDNFFRDGVVVKVVGYTATGELTCQADGTNPTSTWIKVQAEQDGPTAWMPISNTTYEPTIDIMQRIGIPDDPSQQQYANSVQGGC